MSKIMTWCTGGPGLGSEWPVRKIVAWCGGLVLVGVLAGCWPAAPARTAGGLWGRVIEVPGLSALVTGRSGGAEVSSVSCGPAGSCAAGGFYTDRHHRAQGYVVTEDNGTWDTPIPLPGLAALSKGGSAEVTSLSCPSPGTCAAAGTYTDRSGHRHGFVTQPR
jgi:hypothetical protein